MGGGDIKLMAAAGFLLGWKLNIVAFMMGCVLGSVIHLSIMKIGKGEHRLAFGPYLSMGIYIAMICGEQLMSWYLGIVGL
jgi:leader peptidase (prepilin peptidase)/N-methyltransferase